MSDHKTTRPSAGLPKPPSRQNLAVGMMITAGRLAKMLKTSISTVHRMRRARKLQAALVLGARNHYWPLSEIHAWLVARNRETGKLPDQDQWAKMRDTAMSGSLVG
jgi:predicted DNA-binding transcriptional regulator AlpA